MSERNPYLTRQAKHSIGKAGRKSETRLARQIGGRVRPASGAMEGAKGDMTVGAHLLEAKSTTQASMGIKLDWLAKIAKEARSEGKMPALAVSFIHPDGNPVMDGEWVMLPLHRWRELVAGGV